MCYLYSTKNPKEQLTTMLLTQPSPKDEGKVSHCSLSPGVARVVWVGVSRSQNHMPTFFREKRQIYTI